MTTYNLQANTRAKNQKNKVLRQAGLIPAVVYGSKVPTISLAVKEKELTAIMKTAGTSSLVDLTIDDQKPVRVLIQEPQFHYLKRKLIHVDFHAVRMDEKLETSIPLVLVGESPAVEELEGNLVQSKDELEVRCLPNDLIPEITIDISTLKTFDDTIRVSDIKIPSTIEILHEPEEVVVSVSEPISEEDLAELDQDTSAQEEAAVEELSKEAEPQESEEKTD